MPCKMNLFLDILESAHVSFAVYLSVGPSVYKMLVILCFEPL